MIFCCGESLIDMIPVVNANASANGNSCFSPLPGGAIFNTAVALGRLGASVAMVSGVSTDLFGQQLVTSLSASQVNQDYLIRSPKPTTLAFVQLNGGQASYTFYDENSAGRSFLESDLPDLPEQASCLYFGGISLISEPAANSYLALAQQHAGQRVIVLDPNIRPSFIVDEARYRSRLDDFFALADIIKVSDEDLAWLVPATESELAQVQGLNAKAGSLIIVTHGAEGATAYRQGAEIAQAASEKAEVVDTVGAGDTFNAGVLASLAAQGCLQKASLANTSAEQIQTALAMGAKVAAVTVSRAGANPPWADELV